MSRTAKDRARVGIEASCEHGCGQTVTRFFDDSTGLDVQLDPTAPSITADLTEPRYRHRLWEFRGHHVGWVQLWSGAHPPQRSWRPLRVQHRCPDTTPTTTPTENEKGSDAR